MALVNSNELSKPSVGTDVNYVSNGSAYYHIGLEKAWLCDELAKVGGAPQFLLLYLSEYDKAFGMRHTSFTGEGPMTLAERQDMGLFIGEITSLLERAQPGFNVGRQLRRINPRYANEEREEALEDDITD